MTKKEFYKLAKNRNKYRVLKTLDGELSYAKVGSTYFSDTLYELGYDMYALVKNGALELIPDIFLFEKEIIGKNVASVYTLCPECKTWGINTPLEKKCGDCGYPKGITYYDAETIDIYLKTTPTKWIDAEKEVPNEGERVLGYSEDYEKTEIVVFKDERFMMINNDGELESFEFSDCVTHWQPIPTNPL